MNYKEKIVELLDKIDTNTANPSGIVSGNTFLKRIYISLLEYFGESEGSMSRKDYLKKLFKISCKADLWIWREIYKFAVNMIK